MCVFAVSTGALIICCINGICSVKLFHSRGSILCKFSIRRHSRNFSMMNGVSRCWLLPDQANEQHTTCQKLRWYWEKRAVDVNMWLCGSLRFIQWSSDFEGTHTPPGWGGLMLIYSRLTSVSTQPGEGQWSCALVTIIDMATLQLGACHWRSAEQFVSFHAREMTSLVVITGSFG